MVNPYSGIINAQLKTLFSNVFSSLLYNDSLTIPCMINYGVTKYEDCANCVGTTIGGKPSTVFQDGGPMPFPFGSMCPACGGQAKRPVETSEPINLMVIWDYKEFVNYGGVANPVGMIQTITFASNTPKLIRAKEITVASHLAGYGRHRFERDANPQPCGLGESDFVSCMWKRIG